MDGLILINKPQRLTSHDVVQNVRKLLGIQRVGHFGTLDPLATGLMILALGKATRFFPFFSKLDKVYLGQIILGFSTNTYDADGTPSSVEKTDYPSEETLLKTMEKFVGKIEQIPPLFSAKKFKGKPLYTFARKNRDVKARPVQIHIHQFQLEAYDPPFIEFRTACSSGTYIRSLAHDLGQSLQCGAHLSRLERIVIGNFAIQSSYPLDVLENLVRKNKIEDILIPLESVLPEFPKITLTDKGVALAKNGNLILAEHIRSTFPGESNCLNGGSDQAEITRMFSQDGKLVALGKAQPERVGIHPFLVIDSKESEM
jgi:tRNA pseudouridine55 synthase